MKAISHLTQVLNFTVFQVARLPDRWQLDASTRQYYHQYCILRHLEDETTLEQPGVQDTFKKSLGVQSWNSTPKVGK